MRFLLHLAHFLQHVLSQAVFSCVAFFWLTPHMFDVYALDGDLPLLVHVRHQVRVPVSPTILFILFVLVRVLSKTQL